MDVVAPGWTLFVTKEDFRERLIARFREIVAALDLSHDDTERAFASLTILDVTGTSKRLIFVQDGNINRTVVADRICDAYRKDPPAQVVFDPTVSFGASESYVNDNEQALVEVGRHIIRELGCCVRYVHHTGKGNARAESPDQYSSRGGSALPDGARMVATLDTPKDAKPPSQLAQGAQTGILRLIRHKCSYSAPDLPPIWIARTGYAYTHAIERRDTPDEKAKMEMDQVERFLISKTNSGEYLTQNTLQAYRKDMDISRDGIRIAVSKLKAAGRVQERHLDSDGSHGGARMHLFPLGARVS
jgi:hypothetical protein